ncbi:MAG: DUF1570 domain-containing protein, partial [Planctomycetaceae bacterium]
DAYAEAWALTYFLVKKRRNDYEKYLAAIARKPRLIFGGAGPRRREFRKAFGDPAKLDRDLLRYFKLSRLR